MKTLHILRIGAVLALTLFTPLVQEASPRMAQSPGSSSKAVRAFVTNFGGEDVSVIDPENGRVITNIKTGSKPHGVAIAPDGKAVYVSNEGDGTLSIIDPVKNEVLATIEVGKGPNQIAVSADGRHALVTLYGAGALAVVDVAERKVAKVVAVGRTPHIALRSPDGKTIYVTSEGDMKLVAFDAVTWQITGETPLLAFPRVLAVTPDGKKVYQTIRWLNGALVIDLAKKQVVDRIALGEPKFAVEGKNAHGLAVTPDGTELWLTTQTTNEVTIIDANDHKILGRVFVGHDPNWIDFTPDRKLAVVSNTGSNDVSVIDVVQRKVVATVKVGASPKRLAVGAVSSGEQEKLDTARIERLTGVKGQLNEKEAVFKVSVPRSDLNVTVAGVKMTPPMGLTSWAAFTKAGDPTMVMGDMVLLEDQVNPIMDVALENGLEVTALHNHFSWDSPRVMFMHIGGMGDEEKLAAAVGKVFAKIKETSGGKGEVPHADLDPAKTSLNPKTIEDILDAKGEMAHGVYKITIGRTTTMDGREVGSAMGVNTWAAVVGSDDRAVVDGDFAMDEQELQPVLKALRGAGINVVAIHHHMTMESPRVLFLHYWGIGSTSDLARGLKAALDTQKK